MRKFTASVAVLLALASLTACGNKEPEPLPPAAEKAKPKHDFFKQDSLKYKVPRKADGTLDDKGKAPWKPLQRWQWLAGFACLLLLSSIAQAAPGEVFDNTNQLFKTASAGWYAKAHAIAVGLFWKLAAIEFAWSTIQWAIADQEHKAFIAVVAKKLMSIGFFYWILSTADYWIPAIVNGLVRVGTEAGSVSNLSPSEVVSVGLDAGWQLMKSLEKLGFWESLGMAMPLALATAIIMLSFAVVGAQLLIAMIESYVVMGVGVFFLGFNGARWTTDFGQKYIGYAVGTGVKLMMTYLIISVGISITDQFSDLLKVTAVGDNLLVNAYTLMTASVVFAFLCWSIPKTAAALMSGAPALTAGGAITGGVGMATGLVASGAVLAQGAKGAASAALGAAKGGGGGAGGLSSAAAAAGAGGGGSNPASASVSGLSSTSSGANSATSPTAMSSLGSSSASSGSAAQRAARSGSSSGGDNAGQVPPPSGGQSSSRQASDTMQDNAPAKLGSAAPQRTASNKSTSNTSAGNTSADSGNKSVGSAVEAASLGQPAGGQASGTAAADTRQASDTMADNAPQKLGSAPGQTTAKNSSATSTSAPSQENSIGGAGQTPTKPDEKQPSLVDRTLNQLKQVRPPQVPNDEAGGGTVHVRMDHGSD